MKVLHVIPSLSLKHGGPSVALPLMERALQSMGVEVTVATTDDDGPNARLPVPIGAPILGRDSTRYYFRKQTEFYKCSSSLSRWLFRNVSAFDVVHVHALFSYASVAAARAARRAGTPYVVRPLGVLNRYGMAKRRSSLKWISFRLIEGPLLRHAAAVHYTSVKEREEAEQLGAFGPAVVLPLGLDLAPFDALPNPEGFSQRWPQAVGRRVVLFLSRLDPKKGLDLLLDAFVEVRRHDQDALLVIGGSGEESFVRGLRDRVKSLGIGADVLWLGFLDEGEKLAALGAADVFVLPSRSENFGIAAVEALAAGLPSVLTDGVGVSQEVARANAGLVVATTPEAIAAAVLRLLGDSELATALAQNARRLAREQFSLEAMGRGLTKLYEEISVRRGTAS